ncbi:MAG: hypothetical protein ABJC13_06485 [Acidobacteriota bacterium]
MSEDANPASPTRRISAWALVAAIFALGQGVEVGGARFSVLGLAWVGVGLAICVALVGGIAGLGRTNRTAPSERALFAFGAAVFAIQILQMFNGDPAGPIGDSFDWSWFGCGLLLAGVVGFAGLHAPAGWRKGLVFLLLALHLALGIWTVRSQPQPKIDVFVFQQEGSRALAGGENPYRLAMPDIYDEEESAKLYAPGWWQGDRLRFGFPYPPLSLLLAFPGYLFGGDPRLAQVVATTLAGALIAFLAPGRMGTLAAALFLFTPRGFYVLEQGWTEPFPVLLFAAFLWAAVRAPRGRPWLLGALFAVKQYLIVLAPLLQLLAPWSLPARRLPRLALQALGIALAITAPFVLWDPRAFYTSVVAVHLAQPYRPDSLTFLALLPDAVARKLAFLPPLAAIGAIGLALRRGARTPPGFSVACALTLLAFFSCSKQAHANYYHLAIGMLSVALAAIDAPIDTPETADQNLPVRST